MHSSYITSLRYFSVSELLLKQMLLSIADYVIWYKCFKNTIIRCTCDLLTDSSWKYGVYIELICLPESH